MTQEYGVAVELAPGLRRIIAPNPSPMTHLGTNTYLLGDVAGLCVIDPGPARDDHLVAILAAVGGARVRAIVVTHAHVDHSPLARSLAEATGAEVLAFGPAEAGRSAVMQGLAAEGLVGGGEGVDAGFVPDRCVADGARIAGPGWALDVIHTPGHMGNHICLRWGDAVFCGDHVMGWASSLVSPPDGDLTDFMASCRRLARIDSAVYYSGHGAPISDPAARVAWLIAHRQGREVSFLDVLRRGRQGMTAPEIAEQVYTDVPPGLRAAAERNVLAHLVDLTGRGRARPIGPLSGTARFKAV